MKLATPGLLLMVAGIALSYWGVIHLGLFERKDAQTGRSDGSQSETTTTTTGSGGGGSW